MKKNPKYCSANSWYSQIIPWIYSRHSLCQAIFASYHGLPWKTAPKRDKKEYLALECSALEHPPLPCHKRIEIIFTSQQSSLILVSFWSHSSRGAENSTINPKVCIFLLLFQPFSWLSEYNSSFIPVILISLCLRSSPPHQLPGINQHQVYKVNFFTAIFP